MISGVLLAGLILVRGPGHLLGPVPAGFTVGASATDFTGVSLALVVLAILLIVRRSRSGMLERGLDRDAAATLLRSKWLR